MTRKTTRKSKPKSNSLEKATSSALAVVQGGTPASGIDSRMYLDPAPKRKKGDTSDTVDETPTV